MALQGFLTLAIPLTHLSTGNTELPWTCQAISWLCLCLCCVMWSILPLCLSGMRLSWSMTPRKSLRHFPPSQWILFPPTLLCQSPLSTPRPPPWILPLTNWLIIGLLVFLFLILKLLGSKGLRVSCIPGVYAEETLIKWFLNHWKREQAWWK